MEFLVCCVFAYWFVKHIPEIAGETAQAIAAGWRGEEPQGFKDRRDRLVEAGIDPATGGAFGQYVGNLVNDFWLDQDRKRRDRRHDSGQAPGGQSLAARIRDAWDARVEKQAAKWRNRGDETTTGKGPEPTGQQPGGHEPASAPQPDSQPTGPGQTTVPPSSEPAAPPSGGPIPGQGQQEPSSNRPHGWVGNDWYPGPPPASTPVKVPSTVGTPAPSTTPALEGTTMTQAVSTNGTAVTGVISGAAEARAIQRYLEQATEQYNASMAQARKRIHALGEQAVGVVQMSTKSDPVGATAQAAESIAAAQAGVNLCKAETIPLLGQVARSFDRLNS